MKYRYFMINQTLGYGIDLYNANFLSTIGNYVNPEVTMRKIEYASDYKMLFEKLMDELVGGNRGVKASPGGSIYEFEKYDLLFMTGNGTTLGHSSWTKGTDGIVWTININSKLKAIPIKNWDEIITFIRDNI